LSFFLNSKFENLLLNEESGNDITQLQLPFYFRHSSPKFLTSSLFIKLFGMLLKG